MRASFVPHFCVTLLRQRLFYRPLLRRLLRRLDPSVRDTAHSKNAALRAVVSGLHHVRDQTARTSAADVSLCAAGIEPLCREADDGNNLSVVSWRCACFLFQFSTRSRDYQIVVVGMLSESDNARVYVERWAIRFNGNAKSERFIDFRGLTEHAEVTLGDRGNVLKFAPCFPGSRLPQRFSMRNVTRHAIK